MGQIGLFQRASGLDRLEHESSYSDWVKPECTGVVWKLILVHHTQHQAKGILDRCKLLARSGTTMLRSGGLC